MLPQTSAHLATAEQNRRLAYALLDATELRPRPYTWAAAIGFYSAVHYVNAHAWELRQLRLRIHPERSAYVAMTAELTEIRAQYDWLQDMGYRGRYVPGFRVTRDDLREMLDTDLMAVRSLSVSLLTALEEI